jgi:hypothetical protein
MLAAACAIAAVMRLIQASACDFKPVFASACDFLTPSLIGAP